MESIGEHVFEADEFELGDGHLFDEVDLGRRRGLPFAGEFVQSLVVLAGIFEVDEGLLGAEAVGEGIAGDGGLSFGSARAGREPGVAAVERGL